MDIEGNKELKIDYEEGSFQLSNYKSEIVRSCTSKMIAYCSSLQLKYAFIYDAYTNINKVNESLENMMFTAKHSKNTLSGFQRRWFVRAMTLFTIDGFQFDGLFFRKGDIKIFFKEIIREDRKIAVSDSDYDRVNSYMKESKGIDDSEWDKDDLVKALSEILKEKSK